MELDAKNNPFKVAEEIRLSRQKLQEQVHAMEVRDVQSEVLKAENKQLMDKVTEQQKEIERLRNRVHELSGELHQEKMNNTKPNSNPIVHFSKSK